MSLQDLSLEVSYESSEKNNYLIDNFYIPVLQESNKYFRIAGFFSSSCLAIVSKGIEGLVKNNGKMFLLISPELSDEDYQTIVDHGEIKDDAEMFSDLKLENCTNENLQALAWLLDSGRLEIKIVVGKKSLNSLFHQKIGIFFDNEGNIVSFSGSINETAQAWLNNIEEFKVFRSWETGQMLFIEPDLKKFIEFWKNERQDIAQVFDVPLAIKQKIIKIKPRNVWDLNIMRKYRKDSKREKNKLSLFPHQEEAIIRWKDNKCSLLMEMATGTGKTRTAIGCLVEKMKEKERLLTIVATPQNTLSRQWKSDLENLEIQVDRSIIIDGSNHKWKRDLEILLLDLSDKKLDNAIIFTTHATASSEKFVNIIIENKYDTKILFIGDEVHSMGSRKQRNALLDLYEYRIGLSATPERMFDDVGSKIIKQYFGNNSYEFTIADALKTINPLTGRPFLNRFNYYPIFVPLSVKEENAYNKLTQQIFALKNLDDYDEDDLQRLYDRRANIGKNAEGKYHLFSELLEKMNPREIKDTILFVSDKQIQKTFEIMSEKQIKRAKITESESASKIVTPKGQTERQDIISQFIKHQLQILVGIKCLDEGIDIPNARVAILLSNSTNPREYIQRVGRVIRQAKNKKESIIYDFIVTPMSGYGGDGGILEKEARRAQQIAINAVNYDEVKQKFLKRGVQIDAN